MRNPNEDRILPASAIAAMLVAASVIVGLAYWVGDSIAPELATFVHSRTAEPAPAPAFAPRKPEGERERVSAIPARPRQAADSAGR